MGKNPLNRSHNSDQLRRTVSIWRLVSSHSFSSLLRANFPSVSVYWAYLVLRVYGVYAPSKGPSVRLGTI